MVFPITALEMVALAELRAPTETTALTRPRAMLELVRSRMEPSQRVGLPALVEMVWRGVRDKVVVVAAVETTDRRKAVAGAGVLVDVVVLVVAAARVVDRAWVSCRPAASSM
jgi:hypothetical protein